MPLSASPIRVITSLLVIYSPLKTVADSLTIDIEMHQYLDSDGSGTSDVCVSSTIGAERLQVATAWLQQYGFKGFLGYVFVSQRLASELTLSIARWEPAATRLVLPPSVVLFSTCNKLDLRGLVSPGGPVCRLLPLLNLSDLHVLA